MEILKNLGISGEFTNIENLKSKCPTVYETESQIISPLSGELIKDGFYTISNSNGFIHGKMGKKNSVLQMSELIDIAYHVNFEYDLNLNFNEANLQYMKDESVAELSIPIGVSTFRTKNGFKDETSLFLFIKTGFGGVACSEVGIFTHRFICSNGTEIRKGLQYFKCKHTEKMNEKMKTFLSLVLPKHNNAVANFTNFAQKLDSKEITKETINEFRNSLFNVKKDDEISTRKANLIESFNACLDVELSRVGNTAWGLFQGATNYTNHGSNIGTLENLKLGSGAIFNENAEKFVLAI